MPARMAAPAPHTISSSAFYLQVQFCIHGGSAVAGAPTVLGRLAASAATSCDQRLQPAPKTSMPQRILQFYLMGTRLGEERGSAGKRALHEYKYRCILQHRLTGDPGHRRRGRAAVTHGEKRNRGDVLRRPPPGVRDPRLYPAHNPIPLAPHRRLRCYRSGSWTLVFIR